MRIDWDVPVEMDDGLVLRADVYRPIEEGQYPVILSYGPYAKNLTFEMGYPDQWRLMCEEHPDVPAGSTNKYQAWEVVDPEKWVPEGYACVRVDSRGAGRSPGYLDCFSPRETKDFFDCIEWAGTQPWSTGKVGLNGISYYAINQWHVATLQPPHLAAMCAWEGAADWYRDATHHGGILSTFWDRWYPHQVTNVQYGLGERGPRNPSNGLLIAGDEALSDEELVRNRGDLGEEILEHPLDDQYHRDRSPEWEKVVTPLLSAVSLAGHGLHPRGNYEGFLRAASKKRYLEIHGLEHWTHFYTDYGRELQLRFFNWYLKGEGDWEERQPRVLRQRRWPGERFELQEEDEWPFSRTQWTKLYFDMRDPSELTLTPVQPSGNGSVTYEGLGEGIEFWTPPFEEEIEWAGPFAAKLFVASEAEDADLFLVVRMWDPHGEEVVFKGTVDPHTPIAQGWLRASHRKLDPGLTQEWRPYHTHDETQKLTPGEVYELDVEIWPTGIVIPEGYRMSLQVRGRDYEYPPALQQQPKIGWFPLTGSGPFLHDDPRDRPPEVFGGKVTVHAGSYLLVPVVPPK
ncbi:MAG: CocE/NonD family hydrolase [Nitriliruptorales bacterium]|nr:CocE/NonD family hydrolase [Nitriliruptorales bacterium]